MRQTRYGIQYINRSIVQPFIGISELQGGEVAEHLPTYQRDVRTQFAAIIPVMYFGYDNFAVILQ